MKRVIIGAAGLLLSTTAVAAVLDTKAGPVVEPAAIQASKDMGLTSAVPIQAKDSSDLDGSMIHNATLIDWPAKSAAETTGFAESDSKQMTEPAVAEAPSTTAMTDTIDPVPADDSLDGVGGPEETAAVTPATTQTSWPACAPGPGDDNCIQLYEQGVSESYASWQAGSVPGAEQTAMGGPEEAVPGTGAMPAAAADDYPPCTSRSDDRCIQLGENETLASADVATSEQLAMGGPEDETAFVEPAAAETDELAAYDEPLPEDLVLPAEGENLESASANSDSTMAI